MVKIPRDEVEEMARLVYAELCVIEPGFAYTVVGGWVFLLLLIRTDADECH